MAEMILISILLILIISLMVLYTLLLVSFVKLSENAKKQDEVVKKIQDHVRSLYKYNENNEGAILEIREELEDFTNPENNEDFSKALEDWLNQA